MEEKRGRKRREKTPRHKFLVTALTRRMQRCVQSLPLTKLSLMDAPRHNVQPRYCALSRPRRHRISARQTSLEPDVRDRSDTLSSMLAALALME